MALESKDSYFYVPLGVDETDPEAVPVDVLSDWFEAFSSMKQPQDFVRMLFMMLGFEKHEIGDHNAWDRCNEVVKSFIMLMKLVRKMHAFVFGYIRIEVFANGKIAMKIHNLPSLNGGKPEKREWNYHIVPIMLDQRAFIVFDLYFQFVGPIEKLLSRMSESVEGDSFQVSVFVINENGLAVNTRNAKYPILH